MIVKARAAMMAGWIWIVLGVLFVVVSVTILIFRRESQLIALIALLPAAVFFYVGSQTIRVRAKDMLGNGIGSIIFGVLSLKGSIASLGSNAAENAGSLVPGIILIVAGLLALIGRRRYKEMRASLEAGEQEASQVSR